LNIVKKSVRDFVLTEVITKLHYIILE